MYDCMYFFRPYNVTLRNWVTQTISLYIHTEFYLYTRTKTKTKQKE